MRLTVAIGPRTKYPSWNWIGDDTAKELSKYFKVRVFDSQELPKADVVLVVKQPLRSNEAKLLRMADARLIYLPVDFFESETHIEREREFLIQCDLILLHCEELGTHFKSYAPVRSIDHHGKFTLNELVSFKTDGYALWIGGLEHLPYLLKYLQAVRLDIEIRLLTNLDSPRARARAIEVASELGVPIDIRNRDVCGLRAEQWEVSRQEQMLFDAKAAIDVKGATFNQHFKPPTKAQKYISSGLPCAVSGGTAAQYFRRYSLEVPIPADPMWLSRDYYDDVHAAAHRLRPALTMQAIGERYRARIEDVMRCSKRRLPHD